MPFKSIINKFINKTHAMRLSIISITILLLMVSCNMNNTIIPQSKVFSYKNTKYSINIFETGTRVDEKGKIQCSHYSYMNKWDNSITYYAYDIGMIMTGMLNVRSKYINYDKDSCFSKAFNIELETFCSIDSINTDSIIQNALFEYCKLKLDSSSKLVNAYRVIIADNELLNNHKAKDSIMYVRGVNEAKDIVLRNTVFEISSYPFSEVVSFIDANSESYFFTEEQNRESYDLRIKLEKNLDNYIEQFKPYGLSFIKEEIIIKEYSLIHL